MRHLSTLSQIINREEHAYPEATGELSALLNSIALGVKIISQIVATAGFKGLYGYSDKVNIHGEVTRTLDEEAHAVLEDVLSASGHFGLLVSEERDAVIPTKLISNHRGGVGKYVVAFDPLDGSSNIGTNIPVGTIFSIFKRKELTGEPCESDYLQSGANLVAAGYSIYGAKTSFVYSTGQGVMDFTLDPTIGEFILTGENLKIPAKGSIYSVNEGYRNLFTTSMLAFIESFKASNPERKTPYTARYVGSLVADFDRTLRNGGIFLYPKNSKHPEGRLRLLYECIPLGFIMEQAGGMAFHGLQRLTDIVPTGIHQRSSFVAGSPTEMSWYRGEVLE